MSCWSTRPNPKGNKGGNEFFVDLAGHSINLHTDWDGMGAVMMDYPEISAHAADLEKKFPRAVLPELDTANGVHAWVLEGRQLAIDVVYRRGTLPGTSDKNQTVLPPLPGVTMRPKPVPRRNAALSLRATGSRTPSRG